LKFLCLLKIKSFFFEGVLCQGYISTICGNNTCLNGGTCLIAGNMTLCQCPSLFSGTHCELLINACDSKKNFI
jgi:hypothetical protein